MPALTLQVVSIDAAPVGQPTLHAFDHNGGSIGRDDTNFLALPDKHRRVSRLHATISFPGGMPTITNSSTSLPLSVGEQQLDGGESMPITQGALIEIGPYILQAHVGAVGGAVTPSAPLAQAIRRDVLPTVMPPSQPVAQSAYSQPVAIEPLAADPLLNWPAPQQGASTPYLPAPAAPSAVIGLGDLWPDPGQSPAALLAPAPASLPADFFAPASPPFPGHPAAPPQPFAAAADTDPFADLLAGIGGSPGRPASQPVSSPTAHSTIAQHTQAGMSADPLAVFGGAISSVPQLGHGLSGGSLAHRSNSGAASGGAIPDDFNPFHMPSSSSRNAADPLADLIGGSPTSGGNTNSDSTGTPSIDSLFQSNGSGTSDPSLFGFAPVARGGDGTIDGLIRSDAASDPLSLFDSIEPRPAAVDRPMRDNSMEVGSAFTPPLASMPDQSRQSKLPAAATMVAALPANALAVPILADSLPPPAPAPYLPPAAAPAVAARPVSAAASFSSSHAQALTAPSTAASPDALTEAFLRGAGLAPSALPHGLTPEIMTIIGSLLRSATAGAVDMLAARAATKREVQASVTIISVQANNPLKFLPNADAALLQLLGKKMPGFMRADVAMRDAFDDLRAHEVGVIAGTRAALTEVLGKFDPAVLGDKLAKGSVLESLMPSARKAKLWDMYLERYLQIRREAEDDFQSIFGRAFVQAYERETARIKGESPTAGGE